MSTDFNLDKSRWYNVMKAGLACRNAKVDAAIIIERTHNLASFEYEPSIGTELAQAETDLTEALHALQSARAAYEQHAKPAKRRQPATV